MGKSPCCEKNGLKKGPWTEEEDKKLISYIQKHGHGRWRLLPKNAGIQANSPFLWLVQNLWLSDVRAWNYPSFFFTITLPFIIT